MSLTNGVGHLVGGNPLEKVQLQQFAMRSLFESRFCPFGRRPLLGAYISLM